MPLTTNTVVVLLVMVTVLPESDAENPLVNPFEYRVDPVRKIVTVPAATVPIKDLPSSRVNVTLFDEEPGDTR